MLLAVMTLSMMSCTDATIASLKAYGDPHIIQMYSGGQLIREWESTGKVANSEGSDGYQFMDVATSKLVRVAGDVVITIK